MGDRRLHDLFGHPYSRRLNMSATIGSVNYIRNSVKATVDAYDGDRPDVRVRRGDPIIARVSGDVSALFALPPRCPPTLGSTRAIRRCCSGRRLRFIARSICAMPEAFYNREDLWDIARMFIRRQQSGGMVASDLCAWRPCRAKRKPEFLLMQPFTPRSKDNLIGADGRAQRRRTSGRDRRAAALEAEPDLRPAAGGGAHRLGLRTIAKDLALWNQQGSQVLRGQMLVLPINDTFLYVEPIYIQSSQAKMPQLKKVVLAVGNTAYLSRYLREALGGTHRLCPAPRLRAFSRWPHSNRQSSAAPRLLRRRCRSTSRTAAPSPVS